MVAPVVDLTARGIASGKFSAVSGIPTQLLLLHSAECPLRGGYAQSLTEWSIGATGVESSWHRMVDPIARVRYIPDEYQAWHATVANGLSIGWEQAGYARFTRAEWTTPEGLKQLDNLAYDMAEVAKRDGIPPVWLTDAQVAAVLNGNRTIKGFCTHRQIQSDRTDPGTGYPYDLLMTKIKTYLQGDEDMAITAADAALIAEAVWEKKIQQYNEDKSLGSVQKAGFLQGNQSQWTVQLRNRLDKVLAQNAALTEGIKQLSLGQGADPAAIQKAMEDAVRNVMGDIRFDASGS